MLLAIIMTPFKLIGYLFKYKVLLVMVIVGIAAFVIMSNISKHKQVNEDFLPRAYQTIAPLPNNAPYVVQTTSRIYYYSNSQENDSHVILLDWYDYDSKNWQRHTTPLPILKENIIKIYNRGAKV